MKQPVPGCRTYKQNVTISCDARFLPPVEIRMRVKINNAFQVTKRKYYFRRTLNIITDFTDDTVIKLYILIYKL